MIILEEPVASKYVSLLGDFGEQELNTFRYSEIRGKELF